jgi:hypothetical protein
MLWRNMASRRSRRRVYKGFVTKHSLSYPLLTLSTGIDCPSAGNHLASGSARQIMLEVQLVAKISFLFTLPLITNNVLINTRIRYKERDDGNIMRSGRPIVTGNIRVIL